MTLIFYDWEFYEDGKTIEPISLGMVSDDGRELYLINESFDWDKCQNQWLHENVKPQLYLAQPKSDLVLKASEDQLCEHIMDWTIVESERGENLKPIGYYSEYDHVCLAQRFGAMIRLPKHIPMWTRNLKQWCDDLGDPRLPEQGKGEHNALLDARWCRDAYNWLVENYEHPAWTPQLRNPRLKVSDLI